MGSDQGRHHACTIGVISGSEERRLDKWGSDQGRLHACTIGVISGSGGNFNAK